MKIKNIFKTSEVTNCNYHLKYFTPLWTIVLLLPLIYFPLPAVLFGHPWKVELATSLFLSLTLIYLLLNLQNVKNLTAISPEVVLYIILPCGLLIVWSAASTVWANSTLSVLHHTLVWFCYLIFFLFAIQIAGDRKLLISSIFSLNIVIGIIATLCVIEFVFATQITEVFGFRYARFAEIHASVLPLFFSSVLRLKRKHLFYAILVMVLVWLALLFSLSRGALLSAIMGLSVFILLRISARPNIAEKKRLVLSTIGIILISGLTQIPIFNSSRQTVVNRLNVQTDQDPSNTVSKNIRFLFNGVGLEMFMNNPLKGVGADNFGLEFNKYRASFSTKIKNKAVAEQKEEILPERAHNEYLQILAELGIIGGAIFAWFIFGIVKLEYNTLRNNKMLRSNILNQAVIAGMVAFLCSSLFSSFSFRLMQNGLAFFFLLAILLQNYVASEVREDERQPTIFNHWKPAFAVIAIILCLSLTSFSALKATSQFLTNQAERQTDFETAKSLLEKAETLDPANAAASFCLALRFFQENRFQEASVEFEKSVAKGLNTMGSYSYLTSSQILANDFEGAEKTMAEAVRIFPYSVFARVRYASILKKLNNENGFVEQYETAKQLNKKQAETWCVLINEGGIIASLKARGNSEILDLESLHPKEAIYAVIAERYVSHPEEKVTFETSH